MATTLAPPLQLLPTWPQAGAAATRDPFQGIAQTARKLRINESAFLGQLSGVVDFQNDPMEIDGGVLPPTPLLANDGTEMPNSTAILNGVNAFMLLWFNGLVASQVVPSVEGGVGVSLLRGSRQAHFEFSNDGDFSLIMFATEGEIEVLCEDSVRDGLATAIQRAQSFLTT